MFAPQDDVLMVGVWCSCFVVLAWPIVERVVSRYCGDDAVMLTWRWGRESGSARAILVISSRS